MRLVNCNDPNQDQEKSATEAFPALREAHNDPLVGLVDPVQTKPLDLNTNMSGYIVSPRTQSPQQTNMMLEVHCQDGNELVSWGGQPQYMNTQDSLNNHISNFDKPAARQRPSKMIKLTPFPGEVTISTVQYDRAFLKLGPVYDNPSIREESCSTYGKTSTHGQSSTSSGHDSNDEKHRLPLTPTTITSCISEHTQPCINVCNVDKSPRLAYTGKSTTGARTKASIPTNLSTKRFARQCIIAAYNSRLNPFALHIGEFRLFKDHITFAQVTTYLNIRNAILRLWTRSPLVCVSKEEALGCAKDVRFLGLAEVSYTWLVRHGYINFGCVEIPKSMETERRAKHKKERLRTVVVIGAGMSGLGCARQLEGLFIQQGKRGPDKCEKISRVIVLEGKNRIGGRVYSHPLRANSSRSCEPPRTTVEMGAQIITGFEHGNPLNIIVRGQLGIPYHPLKDDTILYDYDGQPVEKERDAKVEKLFNDILERASVYKHRGPATHSFEGERGLIEQARDPTYDSGELISINADINRLTCQQTKSDLHLQDPRTEERTHQGVEKLAGRAYQVSTGAGSPANVKETVHKIGWRLLPGTEYGASVNLDKVAINTQYPTLGLTMDEAIKQYQEIIELDPRDLRLLNWHHANLEYANAANVNNLSLSGWDQDIGNEWEGEHSQIIGGYQQVPRGLWHYPNDLDIRLGRTVTKIFQNLGEESLLSVECSNGEIYEADEVVLTASLGVLKQKSIIFDPPLPNRKLGAIDRLGFGLLNKIILVFDDAFWDKDHDMFGLLNDADIHGSYSQENYAASRGKFYLFWNCIKTSGAPTLVALLAGDSAFDAGRVDDAILIAEALRSLRRIFSPKAVPEPTEAIITKWHKDPHVNGSYSYVGPQSRPGDYDVMAEPVGHLHFAGEATCGTHPATVHGAYLSGLRAAADVIRSMLGDIELPSPLILPIGEHDRKTVPDEEIGLANDAAKSASNLNVGGESRGQYDSREAAILYAIESQIGPRPSKPLRGVTNPFLLFTKDFWAQTKMNCDSARKMTSGDQCAKASRSEVRTALGQIWRSASAEIKQPYVRQVEAARETYSTSLKEFLELIAVWDSQAARIRQECEEREFVRN